MGASSQEESTPVQHEALEKQLESTNRRSSTAPISSETYVLMGLSSLESGGPWESPLMMMIKSSGRFCLNLLHIGMSLVIPRAKGALHVGHDAGHPGGDAAHEESH